jgi:hypothetical protein
MAEIQIQGGYYEIVGTYLRQERSYQRDTVEGIVDGG